MLLPLKSDDTMPTNIVTRGVPPYPVYAKMDPSPKEKPVNFFNTNIVGRHDDTMTLNAWMADTFNILLQAPWLSDDERDFLHDEMRSYICYDV